MEPGKRKYLQALKINIWDPEQLKQGRKVIRSIVDIIGELLEKTKGDPEKLNRIFGMQDVQCLVNPRAGRESRHPDDPSGFVRAPMPQGCPAPTYCSGLYCGQLRKVPVEHLLGKTIVLETAREIGVVGSEIE